MYAPSVFISHIYPSKHPNRKLIFLNEINILIFDGEMVNSVVMYQKANATFGYECYHGKGTRKQNVYEGICQSMRRRDVLILMVMLSLFSSDLGRDLSDHLVI